MNGFTLEPVSLDGLPSSDNLLQSSYWAALKKRFGSGAAGFTIGTESGLQATALSGARMRRLPLLLLLRKLPGPGGMSIGYVPHGPDVDIAAGSRQAFLEWLAGELEPSVPGGCVFLRFDLPWRIEDAAERDSCLASPFRRAAVDVQVPDTVVVDLEAAEEAILARMKPKTRYNIRLSGRRGVDVRRGDARDLDLWYDMARETAARDRITLHAKSYFAALFEETAAGGDIQTVLFIAYAGGRAVAAIIISICGNRCIYHFGASRAEARNLMPTYALQWEAIKYAKAAGCASYDLLGIPPSEDPAHPLHGLYQVKTGFGGDIVHRAGCWDYPIKPAAYAAYTAAERMRELYYKKVRKRLVAFAGKAGRRPLEA